jgi:hypothetical protein
MYRMLTGLVTSGVGNIFWNTILKEIWRELYRGDDKFLARTGRKQVAPVKIVMSRGMD